LSIQDSELRELETLAALRLNDKERAQLRDRLARIVSYVDQLAELPTEGVEPFTHAAADPVPLREDIPGPSLPPALALEQSADHDEHYFRVPNILAKPRDGGDE